MPDFSGRSLSEIRDMLKNGVVVKFSGNVASGKSLAMDIFRKTLEAQSWRIDIYDDISHELLIRLPETPCESDR